MKKSSYKNLFRPLKIGSLKLKNRITMAPLFLGYAASGGTVSPLLLYHYKEMARSGAALIVLENASVISGGSGSNRTIRCDHNRYLDGLEKLALTVKDENCYAGLQLNHAGRFAHVTDPVAPSAVAAFGRTPRPLTTREIGTIQKQFAAAALRVKKAGFDLVELHGGTGYLLSQFVSPRTNRRTDRYGGTVENRIRFPLEVLKRVKDSAGDFPVGYRLLADEWLPDGLKLEESRILAKELEKEGAAYLSVMGGTYESFFLPDVVQRSQKPGYMVSLAAAIKKEVRIPVIAAGRIATPAKAASILASEKADLIGLARVLWVDPLWLQKAKTGAERSIRRCSSKCEACLHLVMQGRPAICPRWSKEKRTHYRMLFK